MDLIALFILVIWAGLVFAFMYVCRAKGIKEVIPTLVGTIAGVLIVSTIEVTASRSLWLWFAFITAFAVLISFFVPKLRIPNYSERRQVTRGWSGLSADRQDAIIVGVIFLTLFATYLFAKFILGVFHTGFMRPGEIAY
ncbi:MAG: hypothetical protein JO081_10875 [Alphaproteobacteria bacterium]|nr:hypothetical protein [Alphaproteobacteria bacterium]